MAKVRVRLGDPTQQRSTLRLRSTPPGVLGGQLDPVEELAESAAKRGGKGKAAAGAAKVAGKGALRLLPVLGWAFGAYEIINAMYQATGGRMKEEQIARMLATQTGLQGVQAATAQYREDQTRDMIEEIDAIRRSGEFEQSRNMVYADAVLNDIVQRNQPRLEEIAVRSRPGAAEMAAALASM